MVLQNNRRLGRSSGATRQVWLLATVAASCLMAAPALAQTAASTDVEEVVVTGTSIRGEQPVGSDLIAVGREDIVQIGAATTADLLKKVPQLNNFNTVVRTNLSVSTGTGSAPGLRGLNANATLVLMDGQRLVAENPLQSVPDPSSIPPAAIERVELVADGASAVYGSDAVAGVINIILRKNLDGAETQLRQGWGEHGYSAIDLSQAFGKVWSTGSAMIVVGYNENTHLGNYDLPFYKEDLRALGGTDFRAQNCAPPNISMGGVTYGQPSYAPGPNGRCIVGNLNDTVSGFRRTGVVANAHQEVTDKLTVFGDFKHTATYATHLSAPGGANVTLTTSNPFFYRPPGATGNSQTLLYNVGPVVGERKNTAYSKSTAFIAGADYMLPRDFRLQLTANYGVADNAAHQPGFDAAALAAAAAGTTTATALDPFGDRTNPAVAAGIANFENLFYSDQKLYDYQAKIDGALFKLPGGEVKVAAGVDWRKNTYDAANPVGAIGTPPGAAVVSAERTIKAIFAEVLVPVVGEDNAVPGIQSLNFSAAVRRDDYSDFGDTTNPKYGVTWSPIEGVMVRASYGKSFHAPDMGDSYAVDTRAIFLANTAVFVPAGSPPADAIGLAGGNPGLKPETAETYSIGVEYKPGWLPGLRGSVTYWNIEYTNLIRTAPISQEIFTNPAFTSFVTAFPTRAQLDQLGATFRLVGMTLPVPTVSYIVDLRRNNLGAVNTDGFDYEASYQWSTDAWGSFAASVAGTRTMNFDLQAATGGAFIPQYNFIRNRIRGEVTWINGPWSANAAVNKSGQFRQSFTTSAGTGSVQSVKPFTTVDLRAAYDLDKFSRFLSATTFSINVDNALGEEPPLLMASGGFSGLASPYGRLVWVGLMKKW